MRKGSRLRSSCLHGRTHAQGGEDKSRTDLIEERRRRTESEAYLPMLLRTVAPCPSGCDSARTFLTTALGFSNGAADEAESEAEDDMVRGRAGDNKTELGIKTKEKRRRRARRITRSRSCSWVLLGKVAALVRRRWAVLPSLAMAEV
jgi:hypothetical protein